MLNNIKKPKTFTLFMYDPILIKIAKACGESKHDFRSLESLSEELGLSVNTIAKKINLCPFLFLSSMERPDLIALNVEATGFSLKELGLNF